MTDLQASLCTSLRYDTFDRQSRGVSPGPGAYEHGSADRVRPKSPSWSFGTSGRQYGKPCKFVGMSLCLHNTMLCLLCDDVVESGFPYEDSLILIDYFHPRFKNATKKSDDDSIVVFYIMQQLHLDLMHI